MESFYKLQNHTGSLEAFVENPTWEIDTCTKVSLRIIAKNYDIKVASANPKAVVKVLIGGGLMIRVLRVVV